MFFGRKPRPRWGWAAAAWRRRYPFEGAVLKIVGPVLAFLGLDVHDIAIGGCRSAMCGFRVVACAATTTVASDGLVAAWTLLVGFPSGVSDSS